MTWTALNCPQCSAPLPRVAIWRAVKCGSCGALITRNEAVVQRASFHQALVRARQTSALAGQILLCGGESYLLMQLLGRGEISQVYLARRAGPMPSLATVKISSAAGAAARYALEAKILQELHTMAGAGAGTFVSHLLPVVVAHGAANDGTSGEHALVLRHASGFWGSLAALNERFPQGLDPRHTVWIWRRMLNLLDFLHSRGWSHGDVCPEHALVHPGDHAVSLVGWASAQKGASEPDRARDLLRSARVMLVLLGGSSDAGTVPTDVPAELGQLVTQASRDEDFCQAKGAKGLDALLQSAARAAFGPPSFVPLTL